MKLSINQEAREIATQYNLENRIECLAKQDAFLTLKVHKQNFKNNPKCRLLNPCKSEIGVISKHHLQEINNSIREKTLLLQWKNTDSVLKWFTGIEKNIQNGFCKWILLTFTLAFQSKNSTRRSHMQKLLSQLIKGLLI